MVNNFSCCPCVRKKVANKYSRGTRLTAKRVAEYYNEEFIAEKCGSRSLRADGCKLDQADLMVIHFLVNSL